MCGRITQHRTKRAYVLEMGWNADALDERVDERAANWNVRPGSNPWLMHRFGDGEPHVDMVKWGYRPAWAADKGLPIMINARLEKAATGPYFRSLFKAGRTIVPADGWYEWIGAAGHKQPWYIRQKNDRPLFMAALSNYRPEQPAAEGRGFVIVTAAAAGGLVDVHDRRPVVFAAEDAALWIDNGLPYEQAEQLARSLALPAEAFEWYEVGKDVNKAGVNDAHLIAPCQ